MVRWQRRFYRVSDPDEDPLSDPNTDDVRQGLAPTDRPSRQRRHAYEGIGRSHTTGGGRGRPPVSGYRFSAASR